MSQSKIPEAAIKKIGNRLFTAIKKQYFFYDRAIRDGTWVEMIDDTGHTNRYFISDP